MSRILIVGGGIGGTASAIALAQIGQQVELIEREAGWRALGAGLTLNGASMRALDQLGLLDQVKLRGFGSAGTGRAYYADGTLMDDSNRERLFGPRIPNMGGIMRPVLHEIMKEAVLANNVAVRTGVTFTSLRQAGGEVAVEFSDGTDGVYDFVVGADGLFSQTRQVIMPEVRQPEFTGQGCFRAVVPRPPDQDVPGIYFGKNIKAGFNPVSQESMYLFTLVPMPGNPFLLPESWPELLRASLGEFGGHIALIREQIGEDSLINYRPLEGILLEEDWYRGRVLLIGDAAHATTPHIGYGAGLSMEDGVVLADELQKNPTIEATFAAFQQRRFARCAAVVNGSRQMGRLELAGAPASVQRALFGPLMGMIREEI